MRKGEAPAFSKNEENTAYLPQHTHFEHFVRYLLTAYLTPNFQTQGESYTRDGGSGLAHLDLASQPRDFDNAGSDISTSTHLSAAPSPLHRGKA